VYHLRRTQRRWQWGPNDCALTACQAVLAMTVVDLAVPFRNLGYRTMDGIGCIAAAGAEVSALVNSTARYL